LCFQQLARDQALAFIPMLQHQSIQRDLRERIAIGLGGFPDGLRIERAFQALKLFDGREPYGL
jgi:hypothetical protein